MDLLIIILEENFRSKYQLIKQYYIILFFTYIFFYVYIVQCIGNVMYNSNR